ncbi:DNA-directed RNA polymerase subunit N [Candidatus Micrarchaeota archaeon CG09_land_8_20_14_0_10_60_16]|nr:MAG: DNA-directed RNA polymerase subunit N [Candidatus Micrarchaeota archaeon CG09_land_8_20_14_0_10_60_16]
MLVPVRCWSCGKPVAEHWDEYKERVDKGEEAEKVMDDLGIDRYCCRRMMVSQPDLIDEILPFRRF